MKIVMILCLIFIKLFAQNQTFSLDFEEKRYLQNHSPLKVYVERDFKPYVYLEDNIPSGYTFELFDRSAKKLGVEIEYISDMDFAKAIELFKDKKLDVILHVVKTKQREEFMGFTLPFLFNLPTIYTFEEKASYKNLSSLKGKKLAVIKSHYYNEILKQKYPEIDVMEVSDDIEGFNLILKNQADAFLSREEKYISNILKKLPKKAIASGNAVFENTKGISIGIQKDKKTLLDLLNKALKDTLLYEDEELISKWIINNQNKITLNDKEKAILSRPVKVAVSLGFIPFSFVENGKYKGFTNDLLKTVSDKTSLKFDIRYDTWSNNLNKFKNKEVDLITGISRTKERGKFARFSEPYFIMPMSVFVNDKFKDYKDIKSLDFKKVGIIKDIFYKDKIINNTKAKIIEYAKAQELLEALLHNKVDAIVYDNAAMNYFIVQNYITNIKAVDDLESIGIKKGDMRFGVSPDNPELLSILQKALEEYNIQDKQKLAVKWFGILNNKEKNLNSKIFNNEEKNFISKTKSIQVCSEFDNMPFLDFTTTQTLKGIGAEFLEYLKKQLDMEFVYSKLNSNKDTKCSVLISTIPQEQINKNKYLKKDLTDIEYGLSTKNKQIFITDIFKYKNQTFSITKNDFQIPLIKDKYKEFNLVLVDSTKDGLEKVRSKEVFGHIGSIFSSIYTINKYAWQDIKISGKIDINTKLSIFTKADTPELHSIISKLIDDMEKLQKQAILDRWFAIKTENKIDYELLFKTTTLFILFIALVYIRYKDIKKSNKMLLEKDELLHYILSKSGAFYWIYDIETRSLNYKSKSFFYTLGYKEEQVPNTIESYLDMLHPDDRANVLEQLNLCKNSKNDKYEIACRIMDIHKKPIWISNFISVIEYKDNLPIKIAGLSIDINEKKSSELSYWKTKEEMLLQQTKMANLGELVGAITHQWRQPLAEISSNTMTIQVENNYKENPDQKLIADSLKDIDKLLIFMSNTLDSFKSVYTQKETKEHFLIQELVENSINIFKSIVLDVNISIKYKHDELKLYGSKEDIVNILLILLNNSKDAFKENNIQKRDIKIEIYDINDKLFLKYSDNAGGVKKTPIQSIFEADVSTKKESNMGIGLYILKKIITEKYQGKVEVSIIPNGTQFILVFEQLKK